MSQLSWWKMFYAAVLWPATSIICGAQTFTTLHSFDHTDGANPQTALVQATDGNLYGTASAGGANGIGGTVFKITASGMLTTLYSSCPSTGCTASDFFAPLVRAADGNFYGTAFGGTYGYGSVFKITAGGTLTVIYNLCAQSGCPDRNGPFGGVIQATDGNFYGATYLGGTNNSGTIFRITPGGKLTTLYNFCSQAGCSDGAYPYDAVSQATDGNLYGTTWGGGANDLGTVFNSPGLER
jgi:uncharacterized repeat protein (TIGR03803 family)